MRSLRILSLVNDWIWLFRGWGDSKAQLDLQDLLDQGWVLPGNDALWNLLLSRVLWFHLEVSGQTPFPGYHGEHLAHCAGAPFPATFRVRRKSLVSSGKSWGGFIPERRFFFCCLHFPDTTVFQLLVELEVIWLVRLKSAGAGGCRQCERFPLTSLPVSAARAGCGWV